MLGSGRTTRLKAKEPTHTPTGPSTKESGLRTSSTVTEKKRGPMARSTQATMSMERNMDEAHSSGPTAHDTRESSRTTTSRARESTNGQTAENSMGTG